MYAKPVYDLFGTEEKARKSLVTTLATEKSFWDMEMAKRDKFIDWVLTNASEYQDGDTIDWIGAFYDWEEEYG